MTLFEREPIPEESRTQRVRRASAAPSTRSSVRQADAAAPVSNVVDAVLDRLAAAPEADDTAGGRIRRAPLPVRGTPTVESGPRIRRSVDVIRRVEAMPVREGDDAERERATQEDPRWVEKLKAISRDDKKESEKLTIDHGGEVAQTIDAQGKALGVHEAKLKAETGAVHGRARHGFQTGADGQKRRAKSKLTPEQPSDPYGTGVTTREWHGKGGAEMMLAPSNVVGNKDIVEGKPVAKSVYDAVPQEKRKRPSKPTKSGGPYAGSFFSPEHQNRLENEALVIATRFNDWKEAKFTSAGWKPFEYLDVVLKNEKGGYGVSFSRGKGTASEYAQKVTASGLYAGGDDAEPASSSALLGPDDAGVDVYLMLCAKVQFKRTKAGWQVLSSFPENLEPGVSPIFNHGKDPWTGEVRESPTGKSAALTAPNWAPDAG